MRSDPDARRRALMKAQNPMALPSEYQQVEWIGTNTHGPFIQTNVNLTNGPVRLSVTFQCTGDNNAVQEVFGVRKGTNAGEQGLLIKVTTTRNNFYVSTGNADGTVIAGISATALSFCADSVISVDAALSAGSSNVGTITADFSVGDDSDTVVKTGITGDNTLAPLSLFGTVYGGGRLLGKIYGPAKAWNQGRLVLCAVPCYRVADSVIGMFDTVNGVFYTNAGGGSFTKGSDL